MSLFFLLLLDFLEIRIPEVQERVADAVNNIVKHFYRPEKEVRPANFFNLVLSHLSL